MNRCNGSGASSLEFASTYEEPLPLRCTLHPEVVCMYLTKLPLGPMILPGREKAGSTSAANGMKTLFMSKPDGVVDGLSISAFNFAHALSTSS